MPGEDSSGTLWVLNPDVVRWGIHELSEQRIHTFFPAYLLIRQQAARQQASTVQPDWATWGTYFDVPGGPPDKASFQPFSDQTLTPSQRWVRHHPAGSYNPSSVRPNTPGRRVLGVTDDNKAYVLEENHWELARTHLLRDERVPVIALCAFLYRNYGFETTGVSPSPLGLVDIFREDFGYRPDEDEAEFRHLYDSSVPERDDWFLPHLTEGLEE